MRFDLKLLPATLSVVRLDADAAIPPWAMAGGFYSITRTAKELSVVCESGLAPGDVRSESGWRALEVQGPLPFDQIGVLAALAAVLAGRGISIFAVSTYDTDYILLKEAALDAATEALESRGHKIVGLKSPIGSS